MNKKTDIALMRFSFGFGALLSLVLMHYLFGERIYSDYDWKFLAPGHGYFPVYTSPYLYAASFLIITIFETFVFGGIIYASLRVTAWLLSIVVPPGSSSRV